MQEQVNLWRVEDKKKYRTIDTRHLDCLAYLVENIKQSPQAEILNAPIFKHN